MTGIKDNKPITFNFNEKQNKKNYLKVDSKLIKEALELSKVIGIIHPSFYIDNEEFNNYRKELERIGSNFDKYYNYNLYDKNNSEKELSSESIEYKNCISDIFDKIFQEDLENKNELSEEDIERLDKIKTEKQLEDLFDKANLHLLKRAIEIFFELNENGEYDAISIDLVGVTRITKEMIELLEKLSKETGKKVLLFTGSIYGDFNKTLNISPGDVQNEFPTQLFRLDIQDVFNSSAIARLYLNTYMSFKELKIEKPLIIEKSSFEEKFKPGFIKSTEENKSNYGEFMKKALVEKKELKNKNKGGCLVM